MSTPSPQSEKKARRYPGVASFADDDVHRLLFCGRQQDAYDLLHLVLAERHVVLFSRSGVGKSSIVNAGLMQPLRDKGFFPMVVRAGNKDVDPVTCFYAGVEAACKRGKALGQIDEYEPADAAEWNRTSLWHFIKTFYIWREDKLLRPVLILDQFEELFTLVNKEMRARFIAELADLVRGTRPRDADPSLGESAPDAKFVFVIREDFLAELQELAEPIPAIRKSCFRLGPLSVEQAREAIVRPAAMEGAVFATPPFTWSEDALQRTLAFLSKDTSADAATKGNSTVEPFQLQLICQYVEDLVQRDRLTELTDTALGGEMALKGVVAHFYNSSLTALCRKFSGFMLKNRLQKLCEDDLITERGRRRLCEESTITKSNGISSEILAEMVQLRLIRKEPRVGDNYYELTHDTLIEPIQKSRQRRRRNRWFVVVPASIVALGAITAVTASVIKENARQLQEEARQSRSSFEFLEWALSGNWSWLDGADVIGDVPGGELPATQDWESRFGGALTLEDRPGESEVLIEKWALKVETEGSIELRFSESEFDGALYVQTPYGETVSMATLEGETLPRVCFADTDGTEYISVASRNGETGEYSVTARAVYACNVEQLDPVRVPTSGELLSSKPIEAALEESDRLDPFLVDRWDLRVAEYQNISVSLASPVFDTVMAIHTQDGQVLYNNDDELRGRDNTDSSLCFSASPGAMSVVVSSLTRGETGPYRISATRTPSCTVEGLSPLEIASSGELVVDTPRRSALAESDRHGAFIVDRWELQLENFQSVAISLASTDFDTTLYVRTPDGLMLSNDDYGNGKDSRICMTAGPGAAQIVVSSLGGISNGQYEISAAATPGCSVVEIDPEQISMSGVVDPGREVPGELTTGDTLGDFIVDRWDLELGENQSISIALSSPDFDPYLVVYAPDGGQFTNDDFAGTDSSVCITAGPGTAHIVVSGFNGTSRGTYEVRTGATEACNVRDLTPGQITASGELLVGNAIDGTLGGADRVGAVIVDRWVLELAENQPLAVFLSSPAFDAVLDVHMPDGRKISDDDSGGGTDSKLCFFAGPGTVNVIASSWSGTATGPYRIAADAAPDCSITEITPESMRSSGQLAAGVEIDDSLGAGDELGVLFLDRWDLPLTEQQSFSLSLIPRGFEAYIDAHLPDGQVLSQLFYGDEVDTPLCFSAGPGTTYVVVSSADGTATGPYRMVAESTPGCTVGEIDPGEIPSSGDLVVGDAIDTSLGDENRLGAVIVQRWDLQVAEGQPLSVAISSEDFDTLLEIQTPDGVRLSNDDFAGSTDSSICFRAGIGTANVVVSSYSGNSTGTVRINVNAVTECAE